MTSALLITAYIETIRLINILLTLLASVQFW